MSRVNLDHRTNGHDMFPSSDITDFWPNNSQHGGIVIIWEDNVCKVPNTISSTLIFLFAVLNVAYKFLYYIKQFFVENLNVKF